MHLSILIVLNIIWFLITIRNYQNIYSETNKSDQLKQVNIALNYKISSLNFSKMHDLSDKSACKEVTILLISLISKLVKFKNKFFYSLFTLSLIHHLSVIILFFIISLLTNANIGLIVSIFAMLSLWSNWMVLLGSHNVVGNFFFLLSIFFIQNVEILNLDQDLYYIIFLILFTGISSALLVFSSPSTLKFLILIIIYFYYKIGFFDINFLKNKNLFFSILFFFFIYNFLNIKRIKRKFLDFLFNTTKEINNKFYNFFKIVLSAFFSFLFFNILMFDQIQTINYLFILLFIFSFFLTVLILIRRDILKNIKIYINYLFVHFWNCHTLGSENPNLNNISVLENNFFKNISWVLRVIYKIQPFFFIIFFTLAFLLLATNFSMNLLILIFILILPLLIFSFSKGPVIITAIFSCFFYNSIIIFSICLYSLDQKFLHDYFYYIIVAVICLEVFIGLYKYFFDILEADLFIWKLKLYLKKNKIKEIYTFNDLDYFGYFYKLFEDNFEDENIKLIKSDNLNKLQNKYVIVPPLNPLSIYYHSNKILHTEIYFQEGLELIKKNKNFEKKIFKTRSSSSLYVYLGNITSYLSIYLKKIRLKHFNLGKCVIIKIK